MKKIFSMGFAALMTVGMFGAAMADGFYVSGSVTHSGEGTTAFGEDTIRGLGAGVGYDLSSWLAVEANYDYFGKPGTILKGYTASVVVDPVLVNISGMPVHGIASVGYTAVQIGEGGIDDAGVAYGVGLGFGVTENVAVIVDYTFRDFDSDGDTDFSTAGVGIKYDL